LVVRRGIDGGVSLEGEPLAMVYITLVDAK
jgi:uncharacterized membrane protein